MRLILTGRARADLIDIGNYIARDNPTRADSYVAELLGHCRRILDFPLAYELRPARGRNVRIAVHRRHVIVFHVGKDTVTVRRIVDGAKLR